ncbi:putative alpha-lactalbumin/lysozyme C [Trypoxylus dichotomus]
MKKVVLVLMLVTYVHCKVFNNCELARELLNYGLPKHEIGTWVCIAFKESSYRTNVINYSSNCYGLFQIRQEYWCSPGGNACGVPCSNLLDDNIYDDVKCVKTIYAEFQRIKGNGFLAWDTYPACKDYNTANSYISNCYL